jgi:uncharacterized spore protein YtfJ
MMAVGAQERSQLVNDLLERIGQSVGERAQVSTVFGEPVERAGLTVIPVAKVRFGFGGGGGGGSGAREGDEGSGGGGGGGGLVSPVGYIEVRDDGAAFKRISTAMDLLPLAAAASLAVLALKRLLA